MGLQANQKTGSALYVLCSSFCRDKGLLKRYFKPSLPLTLTRLCRVCSVVQTVQYSTLKKECPSSSSSTSMTSALRSEDTERKSFHQELTLPTSSHNESVGGVNPVVTRLRNGMRKAFSDIVESSASCLLKGGVVAVPTDTIYGVACLAQNSPAVERIYAIKGRNQEKPIAISVAEIDDVYKWSKVTVSRELLTDLLPGPVTVVFERNSELNPALNPYTSLVGIRIPNHTFMQSLAKQCDSPIALTSANISGSSSCLQVKEFENLWARLDLIVNGGTLSDTEESRQGSTVVDLSVPGTFKIIRPGSAHVVTQACLKDKHGLVERGTQVSPDR
ncbi:yrdC domain-containing protein, mitochondrial [Aplysia californica]|uniref:Threonylcarbamoyl-AMP synthase n=1 Tax=Aplysia californica TaxID=6500 RepID=A0ABM0JCN4_APLCA|nr:yrdC domain-containing protein, mitochondrial [Aplysia californica]